MWNRYQVPPRCWIDDITVGSVVRMKSGRLRTVLLVHRVDVGLPTDRVWAVTWPILHCSWTKRGHTGMARAELRLYADGLTRARVNIMAHPVLRRVQRDALNLYPDGWNVERDGAHHVDSSRCCDVVGVVE